MNPEEKGGSDNTILKNMVIVFLLLVFIMIFLKVLFF